LWGGLGGFGWGSRLRGISLLRCGEMQDCCEEQGWDGGVAEVPHRDQLNMAGTGCQGETRHGYPAAPMNAGEDARMTAGLETGASLARIQY